jgi:hypothetical protein
MVAGGLGIAWQLMSIVLTFLNIGLGAGMAGLEELEGFGESEALAGMLSGSVGLITGLIGVAIGGLMIFAGLKMQRLEDWTLCLIASIVAMIPCVSPCCCIGLPIGIWALVVLLDDGVRAAFT